MDDITSHRVSRLQLDFASAGNVRIDSIYDTNVSQTLASSACPLSILLSSPSSAVPAAPIVPAAASSSSSSSHSPSPRKKEKEEKAVAPLERDIFSLPEFSQLSPNVLGTVWFKACEILIGQKFQVCSFLFCCLSFHSNPIQNDPTLQQEEEMKFSDEGVEGVRVIEVAIVSNTLLHSRFDACLAVSFWLPSFVLFPPAAPPFPS